ncbi:universal stress protein [Tropicibacter sp. S64]|uniref:universal stress protein n=1 Tax=Tropicibacter sp. S64 TaxID=3415122 RepID=UPI003C7A4811
MYTTILVPIAFDEEGNDKAQAAIAVARRLAADGARIILVHVMETVPGYAINYVPADFTAQSKKAIQNELDEMAAQVPGGEGRVIDGHSGRAIIDWAEQNRVDLIVIASHRPGMQDLLLGSTATQVVRHARCAVHVLR